MEECQDASICQLFLTFIDFSVIFDIMSNIPDIFDTDMTALIKDTHDLATAIRTRRKQLKITQTYLASMMGVSRQLIGELEKGTPGVNVGLALDVCRELGLKLGYEDEHNDHA